MFPRQKKIKIKILDMKFEETKVHAVLPVFKRQKLKFKWALVTLSSTFSLSIGNLVDRKRHKISCENSVNFCGELRRHFPEADYSANDYIITTRKSRNKNTTHLTRYFNKDLPYTAASDLLKNFFWARHESRFRRNTARGCSTQEGDITLWLRNTKCLKRQPI